ncbi:MAG: hypothetical protein Ta2C_01280 [Candidatus Endomicrobiellum trichonymphae]|uniref:hypothetical protein n=1 Tax=Endomicrobium trichonymphae TaxID=1408204 RepID=UPI0027D37EA1|nr:MAG: hypothetical protein Ta2C_01280 [Candidatus Endomicrobium trichonymphae]
MKKTGLMLLTLLLISGCVRGKSDMLKGAAIGYAFGIYKTANEKDLYDGCQGVTFDELTRFIITTLSKPCVAKDELLKHFDEYKHALESIKIDPKSTKLE